jgi:alpha-galactosidase
LEVHSKLITIQEREMQMEKFISIHENNIYLEIQVTEQRDVRLLHFSSMPLKPGIVKNNSDAEGYRLVEIQATGYNHDAHHGLKHHGTSPASSLLYESHKDYKNAEGRKLEIEMTSDSLYVTVHMQFYSDTAVVKSWTELQNRGTSSIGLEYVSSFCLTGIDKEGILHWKDKSRIHIPHSSWLQECRWQNYSLEELGVNPTGYHSMKRISLSNTGSWSTLEYLPMGCYENTECGTILFWQIEHNGSWQWEISDKFAGETHLYLQLSGPNESDNGWWKELKSGETFTSVPAAVGAVSGDFERAMAELTRYRRLIRRPNKDNEILPVIFNDYMNCLTGDPTTEKLLPLIDSAAEAGCEYFCIDCGWYSDGIWWDGVGQWLPSQRRFPGGIEEPLNYIRSKGMIPGLWLEIEVMGIKCPIADNLPDDWFFMRHGKRIIDHGRYQLDFRNPQVAEYADDIIDRLVEAYGVGYIKMDYNINAGIGTGVASDSFGDGLLEHNRAYLKWLDGIFERYPELVIENCGSGGMRMDYALLSRHSIQSSSDQTDYIKNAAIAVSCLTAVTPEQCAVWSYPLREGSREEVIFNMINSMLVRIHQSGHLAELSEERFELVKEGINCYKNIRQYIKHAVPFWPLGLPEFSDRWFSLGLDCGDKMYLAVWRLGDSNSCELPIRELKLSDVSVNCIYPASQECNYQWNTSSSILSVVLPEQNSARLFEITVQRDRYAVSEEE